MRGTVVGPAAGRSGESTLEDIDLPRQEIGRLVGGGSRPLPGGFSGALLRPTLIGSRRLSAWCAWLILPWLS
jgi:hypothetical protein